MKRILLILLALTLLLVPGCSEQPDTDVDGEIHTSRVELKKVAEYGYYIYYVRDKLCQYNRTTGEISSLCDDPNCQYSCIFCAVMMEITQIVDERLYFNGYLIRTKENFYAYYDLLTQKAEVLLTIPNLERGEVNRPVLADGWLYYVAQRLRDGGDVANPDDYEPYVGRIPMDGGEPEFVCRIEDAYTEQIYAYVDGKIITDKMDILYATDTDTGERTVLFDPEDYGMFRYIDRINYLDGNFYCLVGNGEFFMSEYHPYKVHKRYLFKIDAATGEAKQLIEEPVQALIVTDDTIYFNEQTIRYLESTENYATNDKSIPGMASHEVLYACDLDGGNRREIFRDPNLDLNIYLNRIIDNCLYGLIYQYDETEHKMVNFYGKVDLKTGEVTPATIVE